MLPKLPCMEPLDLTKAPPRSPRAQAGGLAFLPRTIDKLRAKLPGGNSGVYNIKGFSQMLLEAGGMTEDQLLAAVASAKNDDEVATWVREHAAMDKFEESLTKIMQRKVADVKARDPEGFAQRYPVSTARPDIEYMVDMLEADDAEMFAKT